MFTHEKALQDARKRFPLTEPFRTGSVLPGGVEPLETGMTGEALFCVPALGALIAGDVLLGTADGGVRVCPDSWLDKATTPEALRATLRPILDLPAEAVLLTHGEPVLQNAREALERAIAK